MTVCVCSDAIHKQNSLLFNMLERNIFFFFNFEQFYMQLRKSPSVNFYLAFLSLSLPFLSRCSSLIGQTTINPLLHTCSPPCHMQFNIWVLLCESLPHYLPQFSVAASGICSHNEIRQYVASPPPYFIHQVSPVILKYFLNKVQIGCPSTEEIAFWKFRLRTFPSISCNCNLWKTQTPCSVSLC